MHEFIIYLKIIIIICSVEKNKKLYHELGNLICVIHLQESIRKV